MENVKNAVLESIFYYPLSSPLYAKTALQAISQNVSEVIKFIRCLGIGEARPQVKTFCSVETKKHACKFSNFIIFYSGRGDQNNSIGACKEGYSGILCTNC